MSNEDSRRLVKELMVSDVITIGPMAKLREAMQSMRKNRVKSLVVDKRSDGDAFGILTYTTLLRTIIAEEGDIDLLNVYDIATKPALSVPESLEVRHAVTLMLQLDIKRLVVTSDNSLKGILTMNDIVSAILEKLEGDA